ncbi:hypothetical protein Tco_1148505, partial [Tanacetum coccineum]
VDSLETELQQTKLTIGKALVKLVKKVKKMEDVLKRRHVVLPDSEDKDADISSKQGRNLQEEGLDEMVKNMMKDKSEVFKTPIQGKTSGEEDIIPITLEASKTLSNVASQKSKLVDKGKRYKRRKESNGKDISTGFEDISTGFEEVNTGGLGVSTGSGPVSSARGQREGKAPMIRKKKLKFEEIKEEFDKLVKQVDTFVPMSLKATKAELKRFGEELQTKTTKRQKIDDKDAQSTEEKEKEPVKKMGKRRKPIARKPNV